MKMGVLIYHVIHLSLMDYCAKDSLRIIPRKSLDLPEICPVVQHLFHDSRDIELHRTVVPKVS
jgi:hypothetical protein